MFAISGCFLLPGDGLRRVYGHCSTDSFRKDAKDIESGSEDNLRTAGDYFFIETGVVSQIVGFEVYINFPAQSTLWVNRGSGQ